MPTEVIMPKVDMDMASGTIASWYCDAGSLVEKGEPLFTIETDKAAMDIEAPESGIVQHLLPEGTTVDIGKPVAWIYDENETVTQIKADPVELPESTPDSSAVISTDSSTVSSADSATDSSADSAQASASLIEQSRSTQAASPDLPPTSTRIDNDNAVRATPRARALAREAGIDIRTLHGTGPNGRIQARDVPDERPPSRQLPVDSQFDEQQGNLSVSRTIRGQQGHGIPLVMIHGFASDATSWTPLMAQLGERSVYRIDLPGHGRSPRKHVHSFQQLADMVITAFDALDLREVHLLGHSLGGALSLALAEARADRFAALSLIAPGGLGPEINDTVLQGICRARRTETLTPWLRQLVADHRLITDSYARLAMSARQDIQLQSAQRYMADQLFSDGVQIFDLTMTLQTLKMPTQIIWGKQDRIIPWKHALRAPGSTALHLLQNTGHMPQIENVDEVAAIVQNFSRALSFQKTG